MAQPTFPPTLIDEAALQAAIGRLPRFGRIQYFVSVDSTNTQALAVIHQQHALGISFVTESQEYGRGRAGRRWFSPAGAGVYCTTILPVEVENRTLPAVGFWAGLAAASAIGASSGLNLEFKWPNDLTLGGLKCCGILSEGRSFASLNRVAVGVGINVNRPQSSQIELEAAWLSDAAGAPIDRTSLIAALLQEYERRFDALVSDPQGVIQEWARAAKLKGNKVSVASAGGQLIAEGVVRGITYDGALELQTKSGPVTVRLGDISAL